ncbi:GNAT family N-acetyltransferase [Saccharibacillus deserti]|uniref:GNAT family N-acetyltransferase n=1 Tax=Saccharibacillus deserti TaxID=1634444 RepID=UPI001551B259|nr:GNAT family N-acetyltransferase [Saccharibacillus deserti]
MSITLSLAGPEDAHTIHDMQIRAFAPLLEKYRDTNTSPASESVKDVRRRIEQPFTDYYVIQKDAKTVGAIRIVRSESRCRVSPVFVLPEYQGRGIARETFKWIEAMYADAPRWELDTVLQEEGNCRLYESLGYRRFGEHKVVNERMTLVYYEKEMGR